ncbi:hypothetical protein LOTGIDRAFT_230616 [Lottia gigantea]|uniref:Uncharacterized protein n=1 Tax=Lottia gigantea TaxID=225164 RepID=V4B1P4_LOTGI|nr:hypothetical protein LOTGIDRAFT_230616 [Lottia gigantea]ESP01241.1 hypothetical protein LOTGIDRAFT_230616 [Lottia gigantea]
MFWRLSLYLLLYIIINGFEAFNSCTGTITFCIQNGYNCYLSCKQERNVTLVKEDGCSSPNVLYTNTTGNLVQINASTSEEAVYSCCKNKNWLCSSTVIVFHEVKDVLCIWDLKNVTVLSCSVAGIPDDNISNKFQMSMNINLMFGDRDYDKPCAAISKFDFTCPFEKSYYDSDIDIYVTMVAKNDVNVTSEKNYQIIPLDNAKYKELIIEVDKVTPETCTLILTLPDDWNLNLEDICFPPCQITIEISYSDSVINYNFIESEQINQLISINRMHDIGIHHH